MRIFRDAGNRVEVSMSPGAGTRASRGQFRSQREKISREFRPRTGLCPDCGAAENEWCRDDCKMIDPMDYR